MARADRTPTNHPESLLKRYSDGEEFPVALRTVVCRRSEVLPGEFVASVSEPVDIDPEAAGRVRQLLTNAIASMLRTAINHSDAARIQWQMATRKYHERWAQGDIGSIMPVLSDLITWLRSEGINPAHDANVAALLNDPCLARLRRPVQPHDPDRGIVDLFRRLAGAVER
jgi:hypothetical protein